jgi:hypothetical protein
MNLVNFFFFKKKKRLLQISQINVYDGIFLMRSILCYRTISMYLNLTNFYKSCKITFIFPNNNFKFLLVSYLTSRVN